MGSSSSNTASTACTSGQVGLISGATGKWEKCLDAPWSDDAETASFLEDGSVVVYATPSDGGDTFFAHINFDNGNVTKVIVGGDQGNLRCTPDGSCYGVVPGDENNPTALMRVDSKTGSAKTALALPHYLGYSVDGAVVNPDTGLYHAILVGKPHSEETKSNQWLCTMNVTGASASILREIPVSSTFMGPMASTRDVELMTFGSDISDGLVEIDWRTGKERKLLDGFGTVYTFSAGFTQTSVVAVNVFPSPLRLFFVDVTDKKRAVVRTNVTFPETVHALAARWKS